MRLLRELSLVFPVALALPLGSIAAAQDTLWTDRPIRVNPQQQTYERLPPLSHDRTPIVERAIRIPPDVKVLDAANFRSNGRVYRIEGFLGLAPNQLCRDELGRKWACGVRSRATVRALLLQRHKTQCFIEDEKEDPIRITCRYAGKPLSNFLIAKELALPSAGE